MGATGDSRVRSEHARPGRGGHRTWLQRLLLVFNLLVAFLCLVSAGSLALLRQRINEIPTVELGANLAPEIGSDEPRNFLIIGTDTAEGLDPSDPIAERDEVEGLHADVIMILRVDPQREQAALLSLPRDTFLPVAPTWTRARINTSIDPPKSAADLVETIKRNFGVSIDNYVQIDFKAFKEIVGSIGGVPIYVKNPMRDSHTGLNITETGCMVMNQDVALAYARARHLEYQTADGEWTYEITGDLGRIGRQQAFIRYVLRQAISQGVRNPSVAFQMGNRVVKSLTIDRAMTVGRMVEVGKSFRNFAPEDLRTFTLPTRDLTGPQGASYQQELPLQAEPILDIFRGVDPSDPTKVRPRDVIVDVQSSPGLHGVLQKASTGLDDLGFDATGTSDPEVDSGDRTTITFGERGREAALLVARQLDLDEAPRFRLNMGLRGRRVRVTVGSDLNGVRAKALLADQVPGDWIDELDALVPAGSGGPPPATIAEPTTTTSSTLPEEQSGTDTPTTTEQTTTTLGPDVSTVPTTLPTGPVTSVGYDPTDLDLSATCKRD